MLSQPLGELVARYPAYAAVLDRFGIDFCCGGKATLAEGCAAAGIDPAAVAAALGRAATSAAACPSLVGAELLDVVAHLVDAHHVYLRRELPELAHLAAKVRDAHAARHPELVELAEAFVALEHELLPHLLKEEYVLFPLVKAIAAGAAPRMAIDNPIGHMMAEHEDTGAALRRLRELSGGYEVPGDGCASYAALYAGLAELEADLHRHIHEENNVLFPAALARAAALV